MTQHIHLDLVGGISGDMFIGAILDAFPEQASGLTRVIEAAGFPDLVQLESSSHDDGILTGTRFRVSPSAKEGKHHHSHRRYSDIRETIENSDLADATKTAALSMFRRLAEVEASIHGKSIDDVAFHEVGAWDSIADIVLAAHLINAVDASSWSVSKVPVGSGFVETAHGKLPVPAPATALLLKGFEMYDDGVEGERVTPTGAAILDYLAPARTLPAGCFMAAGGYGFGTKTFPGMSNIVRATVYSMNAQSWQEDRVTKLAFELDDQTPESIAYGLDVIRECDGVLDVIQVPYWGKKGRQGFSISVLVRTGKENEVIARCFTETSTLGVRIEAVSRAILAREEVTVCVGERLFRVKVAKRPAGYTAKVEMDDLVAAELDSAERNLVRQEAETQALRLVNSGSSRTDGRDDS